MRTKKIDLTAIGGILVLLFLILSSGYLEFSYMEEDCEAGIASRCVENK